VIARISAVVSSLLIAGCSFGTPAYRTSAGVDDAVLPPRAATMPGSVGTYIKHVVIVVQENRSFDNLFAGFPGADSATYGYMSDGSKPDVKIPLHAVTFLTNRGVTHDFQSGVAEWDRGKMDGFNVVAERAYGASGATNPYAYLVHSEVAPYWAMARRYVLADHMFMTEFGDSFSAHLNLIAGTTELTAQTAEANSPSTKPWGCDALPGTITAIANEARAVLPGPFPCFSQFHTMADSLDAAHLSWKYYAPPIGLSGGQIWSEFDAIKRVRYGSDWSAHVITPQTQVLADIADGALPAVSWVIPDFKYSDHPGSHSDAGPSWVAALVNAIGASSYWKSTAIVVVWDDWGGWYDHVPPPQLDFRGLGMRVGCLIISPYARAHYVSHTHYEFGSILKFTEEAFDLPPLGSLAPHFGTGYTDERAKSLVDSFDFTQTPQRFVPIPAPYPASHFLRMRPSLLPPDDD
jgi:phospholipase C